LLLLQTSRIIDLSLFSPILVTRKTGEQLRTKVENEINLCESNLIILDFNNVKIVDYSFADELIAKLLLRFISGEFGEKRVMLANTNAEIKENIEVALIQRQIAVLIIDKNGTIGFCGHLKEHLKEVLKIIFREKELSARQLAEIQNTTVNVSNNRLLELTKMRLISRREQLIEGGGKQYIYYL